MLCDTPRLEVFMCDKRDVYCSQLKKRAAPFCYFLVASLQLNNCGDFKTVYWYSCIVKSYLWYHTESLYLNTKVLFVSCKWIGRMSRCATSYLEAPIMSLVFSLCPHLPSCHQCKYRLVAPPTASQPRNFPYDKITERKTAFIVTETEGGEGSAEEESQ